MKRILFWTSAALLSGIYACLWFAYDSLFLIFVFAALACVAKLLIARHSGFDLKPLCLVLAFFCGATLMFINNDADAKRLAHFENEYVDIVADAVSQPYQGASGASFMEMKLISVSFLNETAQINEKVRLYFKEGSMLPAFGDRITAKALFSKPMEALNAGGFDFSLNLKADGIFFTGYCEPDSLVVIGEKDWNPLDAIYRLRIKMLRVVDQLLPPDAAVVARGILLGDKSNMDDQLRLAFSRSGLSHVIAVSGMHVSYVITLLFIVIKIFKGNRRKSILMVTVFLIFFMFLTGASNSAVRASIMALLMLGAELFYRKQDPLTSLGISAAVIVLLNPFAAFDVGFMLSFAATLGILLFGDLLLTNATKLLKLEKKDTKLAKIGKNLVLMITTCISAQVFTIPVVAFHFQEVSLWAVITNLFVVPLVPVVMTAVFFLFVLGLIWLPIAVPAAGFTYMLIQLILAIVYFFGSLPFGVLAFGEVSAFFLLVYGLAVLTGVFLLKHKRGIWVFVPSASILALLVLCGTFMALHAEVAQVIFINVGQGDCSLIKLSGNRDILIDGGGTPSYQSDRDIGHSVVRPYLLQHGVTDIEYMIASHGHDDHVRGLTSIIREMPVKNLILSIDFGEDEAAQELVAMAKERGVEVYQFASGADIRFSNTVCLRALMPTKDWSERTIDENNRSLVMKFDYGNNSVLYMGDLEQKGEEYMLSHIQTDFRADILKVGHHGSKTSTTQELLDAVNPKYAYIPVGRNSFGHPDNGVMKRLQNKNTVIFRADINRDVTFFLDYEKIRNITGSNLYRN